MITVSIPGTVHVMPGATLFPEALLSILETVQKALGTVFFVPGNLVAPGIICTVPGSSRWFSATVWNVSEFKQRRHSYFEGNYGSPE